MRCVCKIVLYDFSFLVFISICWQVIMLDPSSLQGFERQYAALSGAEDFLAAANTALHILSVAENTQPEDEETRRMSLQYYHGDHRIDNNLQDYVQTAPLCLRRLPLLILLSRISSIFVRSFSSMSRPVGCVTQQSGAGFSNRKPPSESWYP